MFHITLELLIVEFLKHVEPSGSVWPCLVDACIEQSSGLLILKLVKSDDVR
jgi:hypothetical protein